MNYFIYTSCGGIHGYEYVFANLYFIYFVITAMYYMSTLYYVRNL
jgi:hypothetical protein